MSEEKCEKARKNMQRVERWCQENPNTLKAWEQKHIEKWRVKENPEGSNEEHLRGKEYVRSRKNFQGKKVTRTRGGVKWICLERLQSMKRLYFAIFNQHYQKAVIKISLSDESLSDRCCCWAEKHRKKERQFCCSWVLSDSCMFTTLTRTAIPDVSGGSTVIAAVRYWRPLL